MILVKCLYEDGDEVVTRVNATFEEAKKYFVGTTFNIGTVRDRLVKCVSIELLAENL